VSARGRGRGRGRGKKPVEDDDDVDEEDEEEMMMVMKAKAGSKKPAQKVRHIIPLCYVLLSDGLRRRWLDKFLFRESTVAHVWNMVKKAAGADQSALEKGHIEWCMCVHLLHNVVMHLSLIKRKLQVECFWCFMFCLALSSNLRVVTKLYELSWFCDGYAVVMMWYYCW